MRCTAGEDGICTQADATTTPAPRVSSRLTSSSSSIGSHSPICRLSGNRW
ncbi:MAG: hypothetical protein H7Z19_21870 [Chitinophagaceae bacterium]|nr:hypothetical protein [Rubrivivax sp.]